MWLIYMDFHTYLKLITYFPVRTTKVQQSQQILSCVRRGISKLVSPDVSLCMYSLWRCVSPCILLTHLLIEFVWKSQLSFDLEVTQKLFRAPTKYTLGCLQVSFQWVLIQEMKNNVHRNISKHFLVQVVLIANLNFPPQSFWNQNC